MDGYAPDGGADTTFMPTTPAPDYSSAQFTGVADGWPDPTTYRGMPLSGRWVRRGRKIIVVGV
jgi:hypothetical protein